MKNPDANLFTGLTLIVGVHMKTKISKLSAGILLLAFTFFHQNSHASVVAFTILPAAISNTYAGPITLQVTGLTNTETVVVQKFGDVNSNGVVDAGDLLMQQFQLTDGLASVYHNGSTAVTNINVPGDTDGSANGTITAQLHPSFDFSQVVVGKYLFVLSSPVGHFSPLTNSFSVTNFPFAQTVSGTVVSNGTPVPNAIVLLFQKSSSGDLQPQGGTMANNSGAYTIKMPVGSYTLVGFKTNLLANIGTAPSITLTANATITTNVPLTNTTQIISGKLVDSSNSNIGLGGCLATAQSTDGQYIGVSFADTNGNFAACVIPEQWKMSSSDSSFLVKNYMALQSKPKVDTTTGSVSSVTISFPKGTAIFYGTVKDGSGNPLSGVAIESYDNGNYEIDGFSDTNGNYAALAVGGLINDQWELNYDYGGPTSYIYSQGTNSVTLTNGQALHYNFTGILATNQITGNVKFNGTNVVGVGVYAYATINGINYNANNSDTDSNGNYSLNVANGNWSVNVYDCNGCGDNDSLDNVLGSGNYQEPGTQNATINNNNQTVNFTIQPASVAQYQIYGYVTDNFDDLISGVDVHANDGIGDTYTGTTDGTGYYSINVGNGNWDVSVDCTELSSDNYGCPSDQEANVSGGNVEEDFTVQTCDSLAVTTTYMPVGVVNRVYYSSSSSGYQLQNDGCYAPYTWSLTPGSLSLPAGLSLSSGGIISGTPSTAGTNYFSVRVTDNEANTADDALSIIVYPVLQITNTSVPNGILSASYSATLVATGGMGGYFGWSLSGGSLPNGVQIGNGANFSGTVSGTPTQTGTFSFTVSAIDNSGYTAQKTLSLTINQSLQIMTTSLTNATFGGAYTNQLQASGGTTPYTWTIANGSQPLPVGLTLSTNGIIAGISATNGTFNFIVRVTDANSLTTTKSLALVINPKPALGRSAWLTNRFSLWLSGASNQNYTVQVSSNLSVANWTTLTITNSAMTNSFMVIDPNATNKQGFYRVLLGP